MFTTTASGRPIAREGWDAGLEAAADAWLAMHGEQLELDLDYVPPAPDPLTAIYKDLYGDDAADMLAANREALLHQAQSGAWSDDIDGYDWLHAHAVFTTALTRDEAGTAVRVTGSLSSGSYAVALRELVTEPRRWERTGTTDGRRVYSADTIVTEQVEGELFPVVTRIIPGTATRRHAAQVKGGKTSPSKPRKDRKYGSAAERQAAYRARRKAEQEAADLEARRAASMAALAAINAPAAD